ncbi:hypothetical protein DICA2_A01640 [Diutina catenulata]
MSDLTRYTDGQLTQLIVLMRKRERRLSRVLLRAPAESRIDRMGRILHRLLRFTADEISSADYCSTRVLFRETLASRGLSLLIKDSDTGDEWQADGHSDKVADFESELVAYTHSWPTVPQSLRTTVLTVVGHWLDHSDELLPWTPENFLLAVVKELTLHHVSIPPMGQALDNLQCLTVNGCVSAKATLPLHNSLVRSVSVSDFNGQVTLGSAVRKVGAERVSGVWFSYQPAALHHIHFKSVSDGNLEWVFSEGNLSEMKYVTVIGCPERWVIPSLELFPVLLSCNIDQFVPVSELQPLGHQLEKLTVRYDDPGVSFLQGTWWDELDFPNLRQLVVIGDHTPMPDPYVVITKLPPVKSVLIANAGVALSSNIVRAELNHCYVSCLQTPKLEHLELRNCSFDSHLFCRLPCLAEVIIVMTNGPLNNCVNLTSVKLRNLKSLRVRGALNIVKCKFQASIIEIDAHSVRNTQISDCFDLTIKANEVDPGAFPTSLVSVGTKCPVYPTMFTHLTALKRLKVGSQWQGLLLVPPTVEMAMFVGICFGQHTSVSAAGATTVVYQQCHGPTMTFEDMGAPKMRRLVKYHCSFSHGSLPTNCKALVDGALFLTDANRIHDIMCNMSRRYLKLRPYLVAISNALVTISASAGPTGIPIQLAGTLMAVLTAIVDEILSVDDPSAKPIAQSASTALKSISALTKG